MSSSSEGPAGESALLPLPVAVDGALAPDFEIETEGDGTGTDDATVAIWTFFMGVTRASADDSEAPAPGTTGLEAKPAAAFALASVQSQLSVHHPHFSQNVG